MCDNTFIRILDKIGAICTYIRNFFLNVIFFSFLFLFALFLLIASVVGSMTTSSDEDITNDSKILEISIVNTINDSPLFMSDAEELVSSLNETEDDINSRHHLKQILDSIDYAIKDKKITTIVLDLTKMNYARLDIITSIGDKLLEFKKSGKKVYAYANSYSQSTYALASYADKIYLDRFGDVELKGFTMQTLYYKDLLDNLKFSIFTPKAGTHKSAVEPYNRNDMSPLVKEEYNGIVNDLWQQYHDIVIANRPNLNFNSMILATDSYLKALNENKGDMAKMALSLGFVDKLASTEITLLDISKLTKTSLKTKNGTSKLKTISLQKYYDSKNQSLLETSNKKIAIVYGIGDISGYSDNASDFTYNNIVPQLRKLKANKKIKAVILYLNTPGGEVFASEKIRRELMDLRKEDKKVIVYMSGMAASGGYWISTAADKIVAQPSTITGSIGVLAITGSIDKLINHYGVYVDGVTTNPEADASLLTPMSDNLKKVLQISINSSYNKFVKLVAKARKLDQKFVDSIAQGKIYTGIKAKEIGLVDEIGDLTTAINEADKLAKLKGDYEIIISKPKTNDNLSAFGALIGKAVANVDKPLALEVIEKLSKKMPASIVKAEQKPQTISLLPVEIVQ